VIPTASSISSSASSASAFLLASYFIAVIFSPLGLFAKTDLLTTLVYLCSKPSLPPGPRPFPLSTSRLPLPHLFQSIYHHQWRKMQLTFKVRRALLLEQ
jgi:hypothetical protein